MIAVRNRHRYYTEIVADNIAAAAAAAAAGAAAAAVAEQGQRMDQLLDTDVNGHADGSPTSAVPS